MIGVGPLEAQSRNENEHFRREMSMGDTWKSMKQAQKCLRIKDFCVFFFCLETVAMLISALRIIPGRRWHEHVETQYTNKDQPLRNKGSFIFGAI